MWVLFFFQLVSDYCLTPIQQFLYARLETVCIMWLGMAGGSPHRFPHNNFSSVYQIFTTWFPCGRGRTLFILGSLGQGHRYYKYNFWQQGRFHITLVLYIESLPNLTTWLPCGRGRILFILGSGSLDQRSRSLLL